MGRLRQIVPNLLAFTCLALGSPLLGADYCSLTVQVISPAGERPEAPVSVREKDGRTIDKIQEAEDVRFCELGILPVTVTVGGDGACNQVVVREVPVQWNASYKLTITYDPEPCLKDLVRPSVPTCRVLFRVADSNGNWIPGASIRPSGAIKVRDTDGAGRSMVVIKSNEQIKGIVVAKGYAQADFALRCSSSDLDDKEELLRLRKQP